MTNCMFLMWKSQGYDLPQARSTDLTIYLLKNNKYYNTKFYADPSIIKFDVSPVRVKWYHILYIKYTTLL